MADKEKKQPQQDATERLARAMEKQTSLGWRFLLGIIGGVGTAIGATIIASVLVYIMIQFLQTVGWENIVDEWKAEMRATISDEVEASQQEMLDDAAARYGR
ncbi:MAG: DUF5665 domain-containing protein [Candidatus Uhrbacteria bacterium]|nr:DUF5665 domain-containing protein [Candidatus Uhrbacteria bacterium]